MSPTQESPANWSQAIRRLHFSVALLVTIQIIIGLIMDRNTSWLLQTHFYLGLTIAALVLWHWTWLLTQERILLHHLFPWSPRRLAEAWGAIRDALKKTLPQSGPAGSSLVGLVHGLGLLALTAVAALGTLIFILIQLHAGRSEAAEIIENIHIALAWILIVYWGGHVLLALVHQMRGDPVITRMFGRSRLV
jgi:cytochrome b561